RLVDGRSQTKFLRIGASEVQGSREDADQLALGPLQGVCEAAAIQLERIDGRRRICIELADLNGAVFELLRVQGRDNRPGPRDDDIFLAENLEYDVESLGPAFDSEDHNPIKPSLLNPGHASVIDEPAER